MRPRSSDRITSPVALPIAMIRAGDSGSGAGSTTNPAPDESLIVQPRESPFRLRATSQSRCEPSGTVAAFTTAADGGVVDHAASAESSEVVLTVAVLPELLEPVQRRSTRASIATRPMARTTRSASRRQLSGERIDHDVHAEPRVVHAVEALVLGMLAPFGAVVLAAVQQCDAIPAHDGLELAMDEVVAPAIQFVAGVRRPIREREERRIDGVALRDIHEWTRGALDFLTDRFVEGAIDIVVVIVHEE